MINSNLGYAETVKAPFRNSFVSKMHENIHEINRSMESIEKMIEQSRKIIKNSRENSLNHTVIL